MHILSMRVASLVVAMSLFVGWAAEPPPPPRDFLEGRVQAISRHDRREIQALAKKELVRTGRASHPIYCIYVERSDLVYVYHGEQRKRADDVEEALIVERVSWPLAAGRARDRPRRQHTYMRDLTNRSSQPLAVPMFSFHMTSERVNYSL